MIINPFEKNELPVVTETVIAAKLLESMAIMSDRLVELGYGYFLHGSSASNLLNGNLLTGQFDGAFHRRGPLNKMADIDYIVPVSSDKGATEARMVIQSLRNSVFASSNNLVLMDGSTITCDETTINYHGILLPKEWIETIEIEIPSGQSITVLDYASKALLTLIRGSIRSRDVERLIVELGHEDLSSDRFKFGVRTLIQEWKNNPELMVRTFKHLVFTPTMEVAISDILYRIRKSIGKKEDRIDFLNTVHDASIERWS